MRLSILATAISLSLVGLSVADNVHAAIKKQTNIPAQGLGPALQAFAKDRNLQIVYISEEVNDLRTRGVVGEVTAEEALVQLLDGTPLSYRYLDEKTVTVFPVGFIPGSASESRATTSSVPEAQLHSSEPRRSIWQRIQLAQATGAAESRPSGEGQPQSSDTQNRVELEEVVVTGTLLRDVKPIAPVIQITREDLARQGYTRLAQALEQLPQNFKAGASPDSNPVNGAGNNASANYGYASGVNLRGLGASATLTLLNGRRLAPTASGSMTDISQIPVSIIDRVEILTDGASSLYGSDAVAGVVNIITRQDYSGLEVGGRITGMSDGKAPNYGGNVLGGFSWSTGNAILSVDYAKDNPLLARNRPFVGTLPDPSSLTPDRDVTSYYGSLRNQFTDRFAVSGDALVAHQEYVAQRRLSPSDPSAYGASGESDQYSGALQFDYRISSAWSGTLVGQASRQKDLSTLIYPTFGEHFDDHYDYRVSSVEPRIDGTLFAIPGGSVRLALGGQFREEKLAWREVTPNSRDVRSVYGELLVPIIGAENARSFAQQLRLSVSGRYDDYSDFGSTSNPKYGLEWMPVEGFKVHTTYARSFQAPALFQTSTAINSAYVMPVPDPQSPSGASVAMLIDGTNPDLKPQTAKSFNAGFTYEPSFATGLVLDASYFAIDFDGQINRLILQGFFANALQQESVLGALVQRNPSLDQINQELSNPGRMVFNVPAGFCVNGTPGCPAVDPTTILAIANIGYENAASVTMQGVDLAARYSGPWTAFGRFRADVSGTYYTEYEQRITPTSNTTNPVNTTYNPLRFRAKANVGWEQSSWGVNARVNYANAYDNSLDPNCAGVGSCRISSWTTVDVSFSYATSPQNTGSPFDGIRLSLDVSNVFNREPPYVTYAPAYGPIRYDPTNANPLLRTIGVTVTKKW